MMPSRLLHQTYHMLLHPEIDVVGARMHLIDENDTYYRDYFTFGMKND